jgi:hypothetical protein
VKAGSSSATLGLFPDRRCTWLDHHASLLQRRQLIDHRLHGSRRLMLVEDGKADGAGKTPIGVFPVFEDEDPRRPWVGGPELEDLCAGFPDSGPLGRGDEVPEQKQIRQIANTVVAAAFSRWLRTGVEFLRDLLYLFVNRRRTGCKVLLWDGTGLSIFMKRLEEGQFAELWRDRGCAALQLTASELALFIEGCKVVGRIALSPQEIAISVVA